MTADSHDNDDAASFADEVFDQDFVIEDLVFADEVLDDEVLVEHLVCERRRVVVVMGISRHALLRETCGLSLYRQIQSRQ